MLITFHSKAAPDILMYKEHAKRMLDLLGKDSARGVITAAETGNAIAVLQTEIDADRAHHQSHDIERDIQLHHGDADEDHAHEQPEPVSFATRAYPLLEMLRAAQQDGRDVIWGV
ncbi:MAG: DUF1840 domain-containing protein [Proteobacteria bacterium]|nr:DUF1840 domain-containing protein [Pseudomonadota bacterium]